MEGQSRTLIITIIVIAIILILVGIFYSMKYKPSYKIAPLATAAVGAYRYFQGKITDRIVKLNWNSIGEQFTNGIYSIIGATGGDYGCFESAPSGENDGSRILTIYSPVSNIKDVNCGKNLESVATMLVSDPRFSKIQAKVLTATGIKLNSGETFSLDKINE